MSIILYTYLFCIAATWLAVAFTKDLRDTYRRELYSNCRKSQAAIIFYISLWSPVLVGDYLISVAQGTVSYLNILRSK